MFEFFSDDGYLVQRKYSFYEQRNGVEEQSSFTSANLKELATEVIHPSAYFSCRKSKTREQGFPAQCEAFAAVSSSLESH